MTSTFDEHIAIMADESPVALILDWYRRLELVNKGYLSTRGMAFRNGRATEEVIASDGLLGPDVARRMQELRKLRNRSAHTSGSITSVAAATAAREAFSLIGRVMRAHDVHAT